MPAHDAGLERKKIEETLASLMQTIARMEEYLHDEAKIKEIIKKELIEIREKFGDDRRTELVQVENEIMLEDLIERHTCVITMTRDGYIKRQDARVPRKTRGETASQTRNSSVQTRDRPRSDSVPRANVPT